MASPRAGRSALSKERQFSCPECDRTYTKLEHLTRHQRTHSNSKPFICEQCGRKFGRQDVLGRHMKTHGIPTRPEVAIQPSIGREGDELLPAASPSPWPRLPESDRDIAIFDSFEQQAFLTSESVEYADLFGWLMSDLRGPSIVPLPFANLPMAQPMQAASGSNNDHSSYQAGDIAYEAGKAAVHQVSSLIDDLCKKLNSDAQSTGVTPAFLDACLHEYFERLSPCFPVIHAPTFRIRECIAPLLLNIFALGSLFLTLPGSNEKGNILWRLGHTAVATSWQSLISRRGHYDQCDGVQLVLTALLGQTYALLSNDASIQRTAFVFHGLGFYWARISGMYSTIYTMQIPSLDAAENEKMEKWRLWAALETQRRAVLGHYILDGLITQSSGSPPSARHVLNSISTASKSDIYSASTVDEWIVEMQRSTSEEKPISAIFVSLFQPDYISSPLSLSEFSIAAVLEGLQSLISELHEVNHPTLGTVSRRQIITALMNLYEGNLSGGTFSANLDSFQLLLRWHTVCLELATSSVTLFGTIRSSHESLHVTGWSSVKYNTRVFDLNRWSKSAAGWRSLLHATAIKQILNEIPLGRAHAPHIPIAIFTSAIVFSAMCLCDTISIKIPTHSRWQDIWESVLNEENTVSQLGTDDDFLYMGEVSRELATAKTIHKKPVNLVNDINFLQLSLKTTASRWTLSTEIEDIISKLNILARERLMRAT